MSDEVTPQGVVAVVKKPDEKKNPAEIIGDSLFLDGVSDPSNVGAAIRSAAVFGFDSVLIAGGADAYSPKSVRASMGGIFKVKTYTGNRQDLIKKVKTPFIVADMKGENIRNFKREGKVCLVIGNEARGVSEELRALAKYTLSIPMQNGMESLNASVSAGIIMFALAEK